VGREEIIYGKHSVEQALRAGRVKRIWALDNDPKNIRAAILQKAGESGVQVDLVPRRYLDDRMGRANHQGIIAKIMPFDYAELDDMLDGNEQPVLVLDKLKDPGNFGNIIRTAAAFGCGGIIIPKDQAVGVTATVEKAASGMINLVPIARVANLAMAFDKLKDAGYWIYGTEPDAGENIETFDLSGKIAIALGAEAKGLSRLLVQKCDGNLRIPMAPGVESLNVASAAAICLYEIAKSKSWGYENNADDDIE
jgi:23S rRNA (guanosine2251-2'-O)-methyltransferase